VPSPVPQLLSKSLSSVPSPSQNVRQGTSSMPGITTSTSEAPVKPSLADITALHDSFEGEGSAFSMKTQRQKRYTGSSPATSLPVTTPRPPLIGSEPRAHEDPSQSLTNNVRNIWGRISTNSNAVFSNALNKVQEAFEEFKVEQQQPTGREMRTASLSSGQAVSAQEGEEWTTLGASGTTLRTTASEDNPWGTTRGTLRAGDTSRMRVDELFASTDTISRREPAAQSSAPLPLDPTVTVDPLNPWSTSSVHSELMRDTIQMPIPRSSTLTNTNESAKQETEKKLQPSVPQSQSSDPLGIANWD
jgi:hypothetical protein